MAPDKDAKQRRQAQNRAQRERLAARREAAKAKDSTAGAAKASTAPRSRWQKLLGPPPTKSSSGAAAPGTSRGGRPARPGPAFLRRFGYEEPGGRAVHFALVLTVAASLMALLYPIIGLNDCGETATSKIPKHLAAGCNQATYAKVVKHVTILQYQGAKAILLIAAPVVVALITVLLSRPGMRKRTWGFGALALFVWVILGGIGIFYFVPAAAMGFGWWQAGKEEREARMAQAQTARQARQRGAKGAPTKPASPLGGLFKRRDVLDTTAVEADAAGSVAEDDLDDAEAGEPSGDAGEELELPADVAATKGRRPKPTKADVAAAIEAGRRGKRRGPQR